MGRVLNYSIKKDGAFTKKEKTILHKHSFLYNSGEYEKIWTCENFWLSPYAYYPNWKCFGGTVDGWDEVEKRREELEKQFSPILDEGERDAEVVEQLYKEKLIRFHGQDKSEVRGFTKVQGNEFNAALIYLALVELSQKLPACTINLSDEGEYLLCAVQIKNGKVKPNLGRSLEDIQDWVTRTVLSKDFQGNIMHLLTIPDGMESGIINNLALNNGYGDCLVKSINTELQKIHDVVEKVKSSMKMDYVCLHNIQNYWYPAKLFVRPVDPEDFKDYKMSAATMMGGFSGEYWKLDPETDEEKESYEKLAFITGALGEHKDNLSILGVHH